MLAIGVTFSSGLVPFLSLVFCDFMSVTFLLTVTVTKQLN